MQEEAKNGEEEKKDADGEKKDAEENKDEEPTLPAYYIPPGGWPEAKEKLRPTRDLKITGDPHLPKYYNTR